MMRLNSSGLAALAVLMLASAARAGGVEDGNAGLDALNRGDYGSAIALFTRALTDRKLAPGDREFAYVSRGKAYLANGDRDAASADFNRALKLDPNDADAKGWLKQASAASGAHDDTSDRRSRWGVLSQLAGRCWVSNPTNPKEYDCYDWTADRTTLLDKTAQRHATFTAKFMLDPTAGLLFGLAVGSTTIYGTADTSSNAVVLNYAFKNTPYRGTMTLTGATSGAEIVDKYQNGAWTTAETYPVVEVPRDTVAAVRWAKKILN